MGLEGFPDEESICLVRHSQQIYCHRLPTLPIRSHCFKSYVLGELFWLGRLLISGWSDVGWPGASIEGGSCAHRSHCRTGVRSVRGRMYYGKRILSEVFSWVQAMRENEKKKCEERRREEGRGGVQQAGAMSSHRFLFHLTRRWQGSRPSFRECIAKRYIWRVSSWLFCQFPQFSKSQESKICIEIVRLTFPSPSTLRRRPLIGGFSNSFWRSRVSLTQKMLATVSLDRGESSLPVLNSHNSVSLWLVPTSSGRLFCQYGLIFKRKKWKVSRKEKDSRAMRLVTGVRF